jgi:Type II secretory pathway, component PulF
MGVNISNLKKKNRVDHFNRDVKRDLLKLDFNKEISLSNIFNQKFNDNRKEHFFSELGILLSSGLDISSAFQVVIDQSQPGYERDVYQDIYECLLRGSSLSDALKDSGKFTTYDSICVKMGEESGRISEVLSEVSNFYDRKIKYRRKFISAISYPLLILITAVLAVVFMLNFLVPMFVDVFKTTNSELPALTKLIVHLSNLSGKLLPWISILFLSLLIVLYKIRKNVFFRKYSAQFMLKLPIFGKIVSLIYLERFLFSMVLLSKSRVSVVDSIRLIRQMIGFYPYEVALEKVEQDLLGGRLLYDSMADFQIFDRRIVSLIKVGEEVNQLSQIFERLNHQYSDDLEYRINSMGNLLEPLLIIVIGIMVGIILIAMYLPMFKLGSAIG